MKRKIPAITKMLSVNVASDALKARAPKSHRSISGSGSCSATITAPPKVSRAASAAATGTRRLGSARRP